MPMYNSSRYLNEAIESILNQTYRNFELIVINDNNPEDIKENKESLKIVKDFKDKRIILINNKENIGASKSMNKAIEIAKGEYIARMDSDDISEKTRLEKQIKFMDENPEYTLVGSWYQIVDEKGKYQSGVEFPARDFKLKTEMFSRNPFSGGGTVFRKKSLDRTGLYRYHDNDYSEDYDLWFRLAKIGKVYNIPEYLYKYRTYSNNITNQDKIDRQIKAKDRLTRQYKFTREFFIYYFISRLIVFAKNFKRWILHK